MNLNLMWKSSCHIWCTSMVVSFKDPLMVLQVSWSWEALATLNALEWLLSIVIPFMNCAVENYLWLQWLFPSWILWWHFWSWEALATRCAIEWLLSSVIPFINLHLMLWKSSCHICCTSMVVSFKDPLMALLSILILRSSCHALCNWMASLLCDSIHKS